MKSLSEIETTVKRASWAAGYSWGIAEEVGKSIRLSELFGFPGIKHLNQYYQNKKKENFDDIKLINKINPPDNEIGFKWIFRSESGWSNIPINLNIRSWYFIIEKFNIKISKKNKLLCIIKIF